MQTGIVMARGKEVGGKERMGKEVGGRGERGGRREAIILT
jgi:hypothetical protein